MHTLDPPADLPEPTGPPPFSFHEDAGFAADMAAIASDDKIRDEICEDLQFVINRLLAGIDVPGHARLRDGVESQLLITSKTGTAPALRVVFSVVDEYPKRHIYFHAAALREQDAGN